MELEPSGVKVEKEMTVVTLPYMANSTNRQNVIHDIILLSNRILVILLCTGMVILILLELLVIAIGGKMAILSKIFVKTVLQSLPNYESILAIKIDLT